jgi:uncharacterized protein (DUF2141 family)
MHASLRPSNATSASQAGRPRSNRWWGALTGLAIAVAALDSDAGATQVRVLIESATPGRGPVRVAVVGEAASRRFPGIGPTDVLAHASLEARSAPIETVFELPPGRYAITVFQDTDQDGELALSGPWSMPSEPYGVSNNPRSAMRAPTFDESAFTVGAEPIRMTIRLRR